MNFFIFVKDAYSFQCAFRSFCFIVKPPVFQSTANE